MTICCLEIGRKVIDKIIILKSKNMKIKPSLNKYVTRKIFGDVELNREIEFYPHIPFLSSDDHCAIHHEHNIFKHITVQLLQSRSQEKKYLKAVSFHTRLQYCHQNMLCLD